MPASHVRTDATQPALKNGKRGVYAEQIRVLYTNANVGIWVTVFVAALLAYLQWKVISRQVVLTWLIYMLAISFLRFMLAHKYWRAANADLDAHEWAFAFALGTGMSAMGWGVAGVALYPAAPLANQVILAFVLGGMVLGAGSILAARPEAFFAFILLAGLPISVRFLMQRDALHSAMGLLAVTFTVATLITTWRIHLTVRSSLNLGFENEDLVLNLRNANNRAETLNQELEIRVQERTSELNRTNEQLRTEIEQRRQAEEYLKAALAENEYLAFHDALTGIPNRRLLADRFAQALTRADRRHQMVAVLVIDLDNFKEVNDTFGHWFGDLLLQGVVERLKARLRASDTIARTGGDEFTILADIADALGSRILVSALEGSFPWPFEAEGRSVMTDISLGVALYPDDGRTADELRTAADNAMYVAKRSKKAG